MPVGEMFWSAVSLFMFLNPERETTISFTGKFFISSTERSITTGTDLFDSITNGLSFVLLLSSQICLCCL